MTPPPTGRTVVAGVIGDPVRHSRSPAILNAAFASAGLDWTYVAFEVPEGAARDAVAAMAVLGLGGLSVTMPHKEAVIGALDGVTAAAEQLGAVNCIARDADGSLVGHNTDGAGFLSALAADGFDPSGARCVVVGAGGAARAVVHALAGEGAGEVVVVNRNEERATRAASLAPGIGRVAPPSASASELAHADLLVNATPLGMAAADPLPVDLSALHPGLFVSDLVYHPDPTPLLEAARNSGLRAQGGLGMLVGQAAEAFRIWTGLVAPLEAMAAAAANTG